MKLALFADLHGNLEAIIACLAHARALGADRYAFLGDLVGYGADPVAVLDLIEDYAADGAFVVRGNHDDAALGTGIEQLNPNAQVAIHWTRTQLGDRQQAFLAGLPYVARDAAHDLLFVHASARQPALWAYVTDSKQAYESVQAANSNYVFCGHVHEPQLYYTGADGHSTPFKPIAGTPIPAAKHRRWLAIVGSAGQPRDGNNAACYAFFDTARERITFIRVPYDHQAAAHKIRAAGLPERLAVRLERGT